MEQTKIIDTFNQVNIPYMNLSNLAGRAWDTTQQWADSRDRQFRYVDSARSSMTTAQRSLYNAEKMRYRYVFSGIDVDSKITASAALFTTLYKKEYSVADVRSQYLNSMDTLGMFMTKIQTG